MKRLYWSLTGVICLALILQSGEQLPLTDVTGVELIDMLHRRQVGEARDAAGAASRNARLLGHAIAMTDPKELVG